VEKSTQIQTKAMQRVLAIGVLVMVLKFTAYFVTHSNAILSDALESIINITTI
jgi:divalent metal cation (Fe/Co/Zn/Cd) transporter